MGEKQKSREVHTKRQAGASPPALRSRHRPGYQQNPRPAQQTLPGIPAGEENTGNPRQTEESLLMTVREESKKAGLKPNIQKTKIVASDPITSWEIDGETMETVTDYLWGLPNHCRW